MSVVLVFFFFSSRRRHTRLQGDWSSDVCSSDLVSLAGRRRDPDAVPGDAGVVRAGRGAELVQDLAVHRPVELAQVGGRDRSGRGRGAPGLRLAARALERGDAVVEAALVPLERGEPLLRLSRAASRLDERSLPRVLQTHVAPQLVAPLAAAPPQRVARVEQRLAFAWG